MLFKDIDECNGDHQCDHNCTITRMGPLYAHVILHGYELQSNNRTYDGL